MYTHTHTHAHMHTHNHTLNEFNKMLVIIVARAEMFNCAVSMQVFIPTKYLTR